MSDYLFVYGTLRKSPNGSQHPSLQDHADYIGMALMPGKLYEINHYPGAIVGAASSPFRIQGEVYRLRDAERLLQSLDEYEECTAYFPEPHEYRRLKMPVTLPDSRSLTAWVYLYNRPVIGLEQIPCGDYRRYLQTNKAAPR